MKVKRIISAALAVILACVLALTMSACAKDVTVTVNDAGTKTEVETKTGLKISEILDEAKITVGKKDETEPSLDSELTEDISEILIKRYAKVTVIKDGQKKEVELVGATVEDAVKEAGFTLEDGEETDAELSSFLTDGMTVNIIKEITVTVTVDGKTNKISTKAATVQELLDEQGIKLGDDDELSEKPETKLKDAMKITVKRVEYKEETKKEKIGYSTEEQYSSSMNKGTSEVTRKGVEGEKVITYKVKYVDGKEESREKVSEKVTKEAVNEIITYGTKETSQSNGASGSSGGSSNSGSSSAQGGKTITSKVPVYDCDGSGHGYYEIHYSDGSVEYEEF